MLLGQALIAGLVIFLVQVDNNFTHMWTYRPVVLGAIMGAALGNLSIGLEVGATVELMFLATVWVGTATPPNETLSTAIAAALACVTGNVSVAIATALPLALLGGGIITLRNTALTVFTSKQYERCANKGNRGGMIFWSIIFPNIVYNIILFALPTFLAVYYGADAATAIMNKLPSTVINAINCGGKMIGAVGLALLLKSIDFKKAWPFFFVGFIFSAYLGMGNLGITMLGVVIVAIIYMYKEKGLGK